jgi:hypothetical protein
MQARKRRADSERGGGQWAVPTISLYVESCLMFIDACQAKVAVPVRGSDERAARASA